MNLISYGIQSEESDMRAHVSVSNATVYLFPTYCGVKAIQSRPQNTARPAYTGQTITAMGYAVPIKEIQQLKPIPIPQDVFEKAKFTKDDDTSAKGAKAVYVVKEMIKRGLIPVTLKPEEVTDENMQIKGTDILITAVCKLQVKCDWRAGQTGNVYLQIAERNISKAY
jgi:hypothetical protein